MSKIEWDIKAKEIRCHCKYDDWHVIEFGKIPDMNEIHLEALEKLK